MVLTTERLLWNEIAARDRLILEMAERMLIMSTLLSRWAERPECRRRESEKSVRVGAVGGDN